MKIQKNSSAIKLTESLKDMYNGASLFAAFLDENFNVIWCSETAEASFPQLARPRGVLELMPDKPIENVREELESTGAFTLENASMSILSSTPLIICPFPEATFSFLLQTAPQRANIGTKHETLSDKVTRPLVSFESHYRHPVTLLLNIVPKLKELFEDQIGSDHTNEEFFKYINAAEKNIYSILRSCQWIADYTKIINGLYPSNFISIDIYEFLSELLSNASKMFAACGIPLDYEIPDSSLIITCKLDFLAYAICNLLSNSLRFTRKGNYVNVKMYTTKQSLIITILDHGAGISPEFQPHIFEPYFSRGLDGNPQAGVGLGLPIVKASVEALDGTLAFTSKLGEGTVFTISIPLYDDGSDISVLRSEPLQFENNRFSMLSIALSDCIFFA